MVAFVNLILKKIMMNDDVLN